MSGDDASVALLIIGGLILIAGLGSRHAKVHCVAAGLFALPAMLRLWSAAIFG